MKGFRFFSALIALSSAIALDVSASAYEKEHSESYYAEIFASDSNAYDVEAGDTYYTNFKDALPHIQAGDNQIFYIFSQFINEKSVYSNDGIVEIELHTADNKTYAAELDLGNGNFYTAAEIVKMTEIPDCAKAEAVTISFADNCINQYFRCASMEKGWNSIDNVDYYVKSDGEMIKKSCKIGGVRYKFNSDGVCLGKYTGWTKSVTGRRYYKDGIMIVNKKLKSSDGVYYYADENGYVTPTTF